MNLQNFFGELKRRNVYKVAIAYAVVAWLLIQIATQTFPFFEIPNWMVRAVIVLLLLGFPVANVTRNARARAGLAFHGCFYRLEIFCSKTTQLCATCCKSRMTELPRRDLE